MRQTLVQYAAQTARQMILNFGPPKSGKTRSLATLYKMGKKRFHIYDFDRGIEPFFNIVSKEPGYNGSTIQVFTYIPKAGDQVANTQFRPTQQGRELFFDFLNDWNELQLKVDSTTGQWYPAFQPQAPDVVVLDGVTTFQNIILDFVLAMAGHNLGQPGTDSRSDYGRQMGKLEEVVESAKCLPCIVIFNCHEKLDKNDITSETRTDPMVTGQLANHFAKSFGISVFSRFKPNKQRPNGGDYIWLTRPDGYVKQVGLRTREGMPGEIEQDYALILS